MMSTMATMVRAAAEMMSFAWMMSLPQFLAPQQPLGARAKLCAVRAKAVVAFGGKHRKEAAGASIAMSQALGPADLCSVKVTNCVRGLAFLFGAKATILVSSVLYSAITKNLRT